ncbi:MAG: nuclear transport factor 2 family protein [Parvibaculaceae bacterium]
MTNTDEINRAATQRIVEQFLGLLGEQKWDEWIAMWADDGVLEFPYAPPGRRSRYTGKADILAYMKAAMGKMKMDTLDYYDVFPMLDPQMLCMEMGLKGHIISTGSPIHQRYISVFKTIEGKLLNYREYWNPIASMDANGGREAWTSAFGSPVQEGAGQ